MPFYLEKEKTTSTPYLLIDEAKGYMRLEGRSFHENISAFFKEINDWMDAYLATDFAHFTFDNAITYFNSSTTKLLFNLLLKMDKRAKDNKNISINWIMTEENDIMRECGEDFQEEMENLTLNIVMI